MKLEEQKDDCSLLAPCVRSPFPRGAGLNMPLISCRRVAMIRSLSERFMRFLGATR